MYIAWLPRQNAWLTWDDSVNAWRSTQDRTLATTKSYQEWINIKRHMIPKIELKRA